VDRGKQRIPRVVNGVDDRQDVAVHFPGLADQADRRKAAGKFEVDDEHVDTRLVGNPGGIVGGLPIADSREAALPSAASHDRSPDARVILDDGNSNRHTDRRRVPPPHRDGSPLEASYPLPGRLIRPGRPAVPAPFTPDFSRFFGSGYANGYGTPAVKV